MGPSPERRAVRSSYRGTIRDEKRFLAPTEVEQLATAMRDRYRLVVLTGAYTGLRFGELAALRIDDLISFAAPSVLMSSSAVRDPRG